MGSVSTLVFLVWLFCCIILYFDSFPSSYSRQCHVLLESLALGVGEHLLPSFPGHLFWFRICGAPLVAPSWRECCRDDWAALPRACPAPAFALALPLPCPPHRFSVTAHVLWWPAFGAMVFLACVVCYQAVYLVSMGEFYLFVAFLYSHPFVNTRSPFIVFTPFKCIIVYLLNIRTMIYLLEMLRNICPF